MRYYLGLLPVALGLLLGGCEALDGAGNVVNSGAFALVRARPTAVGNRSMWVTPPREWNRIRPRLFLDIGEVEDWTQNGFTLDDMTFVTGLKDKQFIVRQDRSEYRQVPRFRADMTPPEVVAMLESLYRVTGGAAEFRTIALVPRRFLGVNGWQLDYEHLDGDELWRRGRVVGATIDGRLYLVMLDAARAHYFDADLPDFEALVASAERR
ncbi:hypothetical protein ABDK56_02525 [Sphingomonas sp. ASV193]|uniref:hypothetical protein n=1 Tax=Sphingomonas sp. ASV193 TaxID=3144405 RepID=UPI0032E8BC68